MPKYTIQVPDGRKVTAEASDEASAMAGIQEWYAGEQAKAAQVQPGAAVGAGAVTPLMGPQQKYEGALREVRAAAFPNASDEEFARAVKGLNMGPLSPQQIVQQDQLFGFGDELAALSSASTDALMGRDFGGSFAAWQRLNEARRDLGIEQNGALGQGASILGQLTSLGASAPGRAAVAPGLLKTAATSGTTGAIMGGVQGFGSTSGDVGQRLQGAQTGAIAGGIVGAAAPVAVRAVAAPFERAAQNRVVNAAIQNAPGADELSSAAAQMFKTAKSSGVGVKPQVYGNWARDLARKAKDADIDVDLDGSAYKVYERMIQLAQDGFQDPAALSLSRLHNLRQKAADIAYDINARPRTRKFAGDMIDGLDDLIENLKPADLTGPSNLLGNGKNAANSLLDGISTWSRAKKVGLVESAIKAAQNYPSGVESGLRNQFRTLLNGKKTAKLFSAEERKAMQAVVNGGAAVQALRVLGIFKGLGGAAVGSSMGPLGAAAGWAAGAAGRRITEKAAESAAERAAKIIATPNIPAASLSQYRIGSTTLPLLASEQQ